jgi:hypothetical protein
MVPRAAPLVADSLPPCQALSPGRRLFQESADPANDVARPCAVLNDLRERLPRLSGRGQITLPTGQPREIGIEALLIGKSNGHMLIICYVNYLLSIASLTSGKFIFLKRRR